jgi:tetratricopeptide (TPR) repeat protein
MDRGNVGTNRFNGGFTQRPPQLSNNPGLRSNLLHSRLASKAGYHRPTGNGHGHWNGNQGGHHHHHHHGWGGYGGYGGWGRYGNWYRGSWGGGYYGNNFWNPWYGGYSGYWGPSWGLGFWGLNSLAYGFGYYGYNNPYYLGGYGGYGGYSSPVYTYCNYNQPLISYTTNASAQSDTDGAEAQSMALFDQARSSFQQGNYQDALNQIDKALAGMPKDAEMNEFRGLALFALGRYTESAEVLYSVLSVGPGWDWPTMIGLYPSIDAYTKQLRALEAYCRSNPDNAAAHFVLGYQYTTCGHKESAIRSFNKVMKLMPNDKVSAAMIKMLGGTPDAQAAPTTPPAAGQPGVNATPTAPATPNAASVAPEQKEIPADQLISKDNLIGTWTATGSDGTKFTLKMAADGSFVWTFTRDGNSQEAKGVFAIDKNVLALEPDNDAGSMLGELTKKSDNEFHFSLIGAPAGDPGLDFKK